MQGITNYNLKGKALKHITGIERFHGVWEKSTHHKPALIDSLLQTTIITSSGSSTRIEGSILSDSQVEELLAKGCKITKVSSRSEREVAGYVAALRYIYDNYQELEVSEKTIRELHQLLMSKLLEDQLPAKQRGAYKDIPNDVIEINLETGEEKVWFRTTPPGPQTDSAMTMLVNDYNRLSADEIVHPLVLTGAFIVSFLAIHPFRDGNGRLSRLITVWLMLKCGYNWSQYISHEKIIEDNKEHYYISLRDTQQSFLNDRRDYDMWINFFLEVVHRQAQLLESILTAESPVSGLSKNEKLVYDVIRTNKICTIGFINEHVEISRAGLKSLMKRLVDRGIVIKQGEGKGSRYSV